MITSQEKENILQDIENFIAFSSTSVGGIYYATRYVVSAWKDKFSAESLQNFFQTSQNIRESLFQHGLFMSQKRNTETRFNPEDHALDIFRTALEQLLNDNLIESHHSNPVFFHK